MPSWEDILRENAQSEQRREKNRFHYLYFTRYSVDNKDTKEAALDNISEGGACILVPDQLKEGQVVWVEIPLSRVQTSVRTLAEVRWSLPLPFWNQGSFIGLRFLI